MILALAGRRIDAVGTAEVRFPLENVQRVSAAVHELLVKRRVTAVVSSAACGADLIGLHEAGKLGLRRRVVLPSATDKFREESVTDRPGDWGGLYETVLEEVEGTDDLIIESADGAADPYTAVSRALLDQAIILGAEAHEPVQAVMVWNGKTSESPDYTAEFGGEARKRGLTVLEIMTA